MADEEGEQSGPSEPRFEWMWQKFSTSTKVRPDKWKKAMQEESVRSLFYDFLDIEDNRSCLMYLTPKEEITLAIGTFPPLLKKKAVYFIKTKPTVSAESLDHDLISGDLSAQPLEQLRDMVDELFLPVLRDRDNLNAWPEVLTKDVLQHFYQLNTDINVSLSKTKGQVLLSLPAALARQSTDFAAHLVPTIGASPFPPSPQSQSANAPPSPRSPLPRPPAMPPPPGLPRRPQAQVRASPLAQSSGPTCTGPPAPIMTPGAMSPMVGGSPMLGRRGPNAVLDKDLLHTLESVVIQWSWQTKSVINTTTSHAFLEGQHPGPLAEIQFWCDKATNLQSIHDQLASDQFRQIETLLRMARSSYYPSYQKMAREVLGALAEANENKRYLEPLRPAIEKLVLDDGHEELAKAFNPMFYMLALTWRHAHTLATTQFLSTFIQEIANECIDLLRQHADGASLLKGTEPPDAIAKLNETTHVVQAFRSAYAARKAQVEREQPQRPWRVDPQVIFARLNRFTRALGQLKQLFQTYLSFAKLEKVIIGGPKGEELTRQVAVVLEEFTAEQDRLSNLGYDPLDPDSETFPGDYARFTQLISDWAHRMGAIALLAIGTSSSVEDAFKVLDSFEDLLEQSDIDSELNKKFLTLLREYSAELDAVHAAFARHTSVPPIYANMPPIAGAVWWVRALMRRVESPVAKLEQYASQLLQSVVGRDVMAHHDRLLKELHEFQLERFTAWEQSIDVSVANKLELPLLRDQSPEPAPTDNSPLLPKHKYAAIEVNFDPALVALLREVKYFRDLDIEVPSSALAIYEQAETFRNFTSSLELIMERYNRSIRTMLAEEEPLLIQMIRSAQEVLQEGIGTLTWKSEGIPEFLSRLDAAVLEISDRMDRAHANIADIVARMDRWAARPLIKRDAKDRKFLNVADEREKLHSRNQEIREGVAFIQGKISENNRIFGEFPLDSKEWRDYLRYVSGTLQSGFVKLIQVSFEYLLSQMEETQGTPLLELRMTLVEGEGMRFTPCIDTESEGSLAAILQEWTNGFYRTASLMPCLDCDGDYEASVRQDTNLLALEQRLHSAMATTRKQCKRFRKQFLPFSYLWEIDLAQFFEQFKAEGPQFKQVLANQRAAQNKKKAAAAPATARDAPPPAEGDEAPPPEEEELTGPPTLSAFESEIKLIRQQATKVEDVKDIMRATWIRADGKKAKLSVAELIQRWADVFIQHLHQRVVGSLGDLGEFIQRVNEELQREVEPDTLQEALIVLRDLKLRTEATDEMFDPLREIVNILKRLAIPLPGDVMEQLDELPVGWSKVKRLSYNVKDSLRSMINDMRAKYHTLAEEFALKIGDFRREFQADAIFLYPTGEAAYESLDSFHRRIAELETEADEINRVEDLLEVAQHDYQRLKQCRTELSLCKHVWDLALLTQSRFAEWKKTEWQAIDTGTIEQKCKEITQEIRSLDKSVRAWEVYTGLETATKEFQSSMPLVSQLRSPCMRPHHWNQLMRICKVEFTISADFTLKDLLDLELHKFADDVTETVERAAKEQTIEKTLREIEEAWSGIDLTFTTHERTQTPILGINEEMIEQLEDNQMKVQNLMSQKHIEHFLTELTAWQDKLGAVSSVVEIWIEVQRMWAHLESIFIGSVDIRAQLPEDSERFEQIDIEWKQMMHDAVQVPNAINCCGRKGFLDQFEKLSKMLTLCQKSLDEYLETKRRSFPRFYFVSAADLLEILSKGADPHAIMNHMPKLFDSIKTLQFQEHEGQKTNVAIGMYSKEGEYVPFHEPLVLEGKVEDWLNTVIDRMRGTLRHILADAVVTYEERPREQHLNDYPAQIALVTGQIWWTNEVKYAFEALEEGNENALKDYNKKQINALNALVQRIQRPLERNDRQKIMTIVTIDVHSRDVVTMLIREKVENANCFGWQSQLRLIWNDDLKHCQVFQCDAFFDYFYEYLGCTARLVVTPLTDRCYITLTQSLHLIMGGAPAGPAGTGKTETVKDLGRALAMMVYVFNCSEQMDYRSLGNIFKGLAMSGSWGCFDEFNRISIEVLSVVATQVKSILDAIRSKKKTFDFLEEHISLTPTCGMFITMNPGYAGRTELPENLKALFRPVSMVVPDFGLISEIMLMAEGFLDARELAKKFTTLYSLNKELLSKQAHYDWGLRAIKSVLVVAGSLKRADPHLPEEQILMRALRDFNLPKIVTADIEVFMGLIGDLFPRMNPARKINQQLEDDIRQVTIESHLQPEDGFILKVVQLQELLDVRHSVFIIGPPGSGKTQVWKMLAKAVSKRQGKVLTPDLNPKAVTGNELYGYQTLQREWHDGIFSITMRNLSEMQDTNPKWIILDGDIDPNWIESLNTVMDDNKVLTLASNERIPLQPHMRLIFEIGHVKYATPATVSRAGILYINETDVGWAPFVQSWLETKFDNTSLRSTLQVLFDTYMPPVLDTCKKRFKVLTPMFDFNIIQTLCYMLECLLTRDIQQLEKEIIETYFVFACIWACGGALLVDQIHDYRIEFSRWWRSDFKTIKIPDQGTVFDYYLDSAQGHKWAPWQQMVPAYEHDPEIPVTSVCVTTPDTQRVLYWANLLMRDRRPVMLVGNAGCGKTMLCKAKLDSLPEDTLYANINFNYYTTSKDLQFIMESHLVRKVGRRYGPPGTKKLVYFVDDLNMPMIDEYGTQQPITLLRQHLDFSHWYEREGGMRLREVQNCQYLTAMNPTTGSFTVNPRLQRHFAVFGIYFPSQPSLRHICNSILQGHFGGFCQSIQRMIPSILNGMLELHKRVAAQFLPTAIKFHYQFNLREIAGVMSGLQQASADTFKTPLQLARLWWHESQRVYSDRLTSHEELGNFHQILSGIADNAIGSEVDKDQLKEAPHLVCPFASGIGQRSYNEVREQFVGLKRLLDEALEQHNEVNAAMDLVLFEDAMSHVCRISRIIDRPRGNALLVGVGGSGKQSLARLAAFISGYDVFQITITSSYNVENLKEDLKALYLKTGLKSMPTMFLFTDTQIVDERFLVYINDVLSSGIIPDLFVQEDRDMILSGLRNELKSLGVPESKFMDFFIDRVRSNLHVVLCFSPVGDLFRQRARKFPALFNSTVIDWFHGWPHEALLSVAERFLSDVELGEDNVRSGVVQFMAYAQATVGEISKEYLQQERRHNHTTPKSFLELISLYKSMLDKKRAEIQEAVERLERGLIQLENTGKKVDELKEDLERRQVLVAEKKQKADELLEHVGKETTKVEAEQALASVEEEKATKVATEVTQQEEECSRDLERAEPMIQQAEAALATLNKPNLTELKSMARPPAEVADVMASVLYLMSPPSGLPRDVSWNAAKKTMNQVDQFLTSLLNFDKDHIPARNLAAVKPYLERPGFNGEAIHKKSAAAAGICEWVRNIVAYYEIYCEVQPKRERLQEARDRLQAARNKLEVVQSKVNRLNRQLQALTQQFEQATEEKNSVEEQARKCQEKLDLANRLVNGLSSEAVRWTESVSVLHHSEETLVGNMLLASAFISYIGPFNKAFRHELLYNRFIPFMQENGIPLSDDVDPLKLLTHDAQIAEWANQGLPNDRLSIENAVITTQCQRWPLIIDPQLQGITWIKNREAEALTTVRLNQPKYLDRMELCLQNGTPILIENIGEVIDAVLDPVIGRNVTRKARMLKIKLGDKTIDYDPKFKLFIQTKLSNPHYRPEIQAQTTLVNFTVTEEGLEDQLLAHVVNRERPELEEKKAELMTQQNAFKIKLKQLEDSLLENLSNAKGDILGDVALIEGLETTKAMAQEIKEKVELAKRTEADINAIREAYRPVATRASMLYFLVNDLWKIDHMYQFSLKAFITVFYTAMNLAEAAEETEQRVLNLIDSLTFLVFSYVSRGLFVKHKLIFSTQLTLRVHSRAGNLDPEIMDCLIRGKKIFGQASPIEWINDPTWASIMAIKEIDTFKLLPTDIEGSQKRWKEWCDHESPENAPLPQDWKNRSSFEKLLILRALRPDRLTYALSMFIEEYMGRRYVDSVPFNIEKVFPETSPASPMFFILSAGVDPIKDLEGLGRKLGFTKDNNKLKIISLGQGQEPIAEQGLDYAAQQGSWIMLENIHLTYKWLPALEKKLEVLSEGTHEDFRVFLSAEPTPAGPMAIPPGILQNSIKVTNEAPRGLRANMRSALAQFDQDTLEKCSKQNEFKSILFALCFFHGVILERRKFGPQGWNRSYPFNTGDLTISVDVLYNYLEQNPKIPWEDLRYIFGEIMYGGHISDDWDRRLCKTYLECLMTENLFTECDLGPGFPAPPPSSYDEYRQYIEEMLPPENPYIFGLHPNAEIGFLTEQAETLFRTILELQPRSAGASGGQSREEKVNELLDSILDGLAENFDMLEMYQRIHGQERTPYMSVCLQECDRMNMLLDEMRNSLKELKLGLKGDLSMSQAMEDLMNSLYIDHVPTTWAGKAYPSLKTLPAWLADLHDRIRQLQEWTMDLSLPKSVWLPGLFNPQAFLTAIMQTMARKNQWPLDKMCLQTEVTKKTPDDIGSAPREGAYIHGLFLEGARLNNAGFLVESILKDLHPSVPVMFVKAIPLDKAEVKDVYHCPVYMTRVRGPTFVWEFTLKTKVPESRWILAGVCLLLSL